MFESFLLPVTFVTLFALFLVYSVAYILLGNEMGKTGGEAFSRFRSKWWWLWDPFCQVQMMEIVFSSKLERSQKAKKLQKTVLLAFTAIFVIILLL